MFINEDIICNFLRQSIEQLKALTPPSHHQWGATEIERKENGYKVCLPMRPDFSIFIGFRHTPKQLSSVGDLTEVLEADARYQKIRRESTERWLWLEPDQVILSIINDYVWQLDQLKYDEQWARQIAKNFLRSLGNGSSEIICYGVVHGLECDFDCHTLADEVQLRKLNDDEIVQLIERNRALLDEDDLPMNRCLLEQQFELPISQQPPDINAATANFDDVITALRLLKEGHVERQNIYVRRKYPGQLAIITGGRLATGRIKRYPPSCAYSLSEADMPTLKDILEAIKHRSIPVRLRTAVDRVNFAAERERPDDQLLDLLIAMEAIFGDSPGGIGYKIGLRCAVFIETDYEERDRIRTLINDAYKRRSALVHGGKKNSLKLTTDEIVGELLVLVRKSINRIVKRLLSKEGVPKGKDFDKMLLQPEQNRGDK